MVHFTRVPHLRFQLIGPRHYGMLRADRGWRSGLRLGCTKNAAIGWNHHQPQPR